MSPPERVMVCIAPRAESRELVAQAARLSRSLAASWIALYVETPKLARLPHRRREEVLEILQYAHELGAETYTLGTLDIARTIIEFARSRGVTRIVVGAPSRHAYIRRIAGSLVDSLVASGFEGTVEIVGCASPASAEGSLEAHTPTAIPSASPLPRRRWSRYVLAALLILLSSATSMLVDELLPSSSVIMLYLLAALVSGLYLGRGPAIFSAIAASLAYNYLFTSPQMTLHIYHLPELVNFGALMLVGLVVAQLAARARHQARVALHREERAVSLGALTGSLLSAQNERDIGRVASESMARAFGATVDLWVCDRKNSSQGIRCVSQGEVQDADDTTIREMFANARGRKETLLLRESLYYMPVIGNDRAVAVLVIRPGVATRLIAPEPRRAVQAYAHQLALALERVQLMEEKEQALLAARAEDIRNDLLAGLSHDLRTPLASILGSASALVENSADLSECSRHELIATIHEETVRMTRLVSNLLEMTRLTQGFAKLKREWIPLDELIGSVRHRLSSALRDHHVIVRLDRSVPLALVDGVLFEQVLQNLLENAAKYSRPSTSIEITSAPYVDDGNRCLKLSIANCGMSIPPESKGLIFEKFYRADTETAQSGLGLGLALCKSIVYLHGGNIGVEDLEGGGSIFWVTLPLAEHEPTLPEQSAMS